MRLEIQKGAVALAALVVLAVAAPEPAHAAGFDLNPQIVAAYAFATNAQPGVTSSRFALVANLPGVRLGETGFLRNVYLLGVAVDVRSVPGFEDLPADYIGVGTPFVTYLFGDGQVLAQVGGFRDIGAEGDTHVYAGLGYSAKSAGAMAIKRAKQKADREARDRSKLNAVLAGGSSGGAGATE
jgi:hypothetical protein